MRLLPFALALAGTFPVMGGAQPAPIEELHKLYIYDHSLPLDCRDTIVEQAADYRIRDVTYASPREGRVTAYLVEPTAPGPHPALLFGHWGNGVRTEFLAEAILYAQAGAVSLLVDYPWVRPGEWRRNMSNFTDAEYDRDLAIQCVQDLMRGIDLLAAWPDVDTSRIAYVGHSYGAQWGAIITSQDRRVKASVLIGGVPSLADIVLDSGDPDFVQLREIYPLDSIKKYLEVNAVIDAIRYIPYTSPTPVFFQFARYERYFDEEDMTRYAAAAGEPKQVRWYATGHELNDLRASADRAYWLQEQIGLRPVAPLLQRGIERRPE